MSRATFFGLLAYLGVAAVGQVHAATVQHSEPLRGYRLGGSTDAAKPSPGAPAAVTFNAFNRDFTLELEPNGRLAAVQARLTLPAGTGAYRGKVAGRPDSWVRIVLSPSGPSGIVFDGDTLYGIESGRDSIAKAAGSPAMFRLADVYFAPGELGCEVGAVAPIDGATAMSAMKQEFPALAAAGASFNLDIGAVADFEFAQAFGASAETALLTRFNNVDGIFSSQLGVQITVAEVDVFDTNSDPFTTSAPSALLDELANYRGATPSQDAQGLTHLFTGRDLDGSTSGIAYLGSVCAQRTRFDTRSFGVGLSEGVRGATLDSLVAAHEIGHNFGAPHDGDPNEACASTPTTFLMAPSINGSNEFSACSIAQMQPEISSATCLTPIGAPNMALQLQQPTQALPIGVSFNRTASVTNLGVDTATNVTFTANTAPGLTILGAAAAGASCVAAGSTASCSLGAVAGSVSRDVTLTLRAATAGTFGLTASVGADSDSDPANNDAAVTITTAPTVDLVVTGTAAGIQVNQQTTVNAALENRSDVGATNLAVTATLSAGLRADSATLGGTACTIGGPTITCAPRALAARSTLAFVVTATGIAAGNQTVTVSAAANEHEGAPADNQLAIGVSVGSGEDDGGGGALSWWIVALLAAGIKRRRQSLPTPP